MILSILILLIIIPTTIIISMIIIIITTIVTLCIYVELPVKKFKNVLREEYFVYFSTLNSVYIYINM